jgi:hypothetical protein
MATADDIVRAFIRQVAADSPLTPRSELMRLEFALQKEWGGTRCYVGMLPDTEPRKAEHPGAEP